MFALVKSYLVPAVITIALWLTIPLAYHVTRLAWATGGPAAADQAIVWVLKQVETQAKQKDPANVQKDPAR